MAVKKASHDVITCVNSWEKHLERGNGKLINSKGYFEGEKNVKYFRAKTLKSITF